MPSRVILRRSANCEIPVADCRHASFSALIITPTATKTSTPSSSLLSVTAQDRAGSSQKYVAAVAQIAVVTSPGLSPPSQALSMIAGKSVMKGSLIPQTGSKARRTRTASPATATACTYRASGEERIAPTTVEWTFMAGLAIITDVSFFSGSGGAQRRAGKC